MTLPINSGDREYNKFVEDATTPSKTAIRVQQTYLDEQSMAPIFLDFVHHMIHGCEYYSMGDIVLDIDAAGIQNWLVTVPNTTKRYHSVIQITASNSGQAWFQEQPIITASGTPLAVLNNDRNSLNTSSLLVFRNPTVLSTGSGLVCDVIGSNSNQARTGGALRITSEHILKQGAGYLARFIATSANTNVAFRLEFYELDA